MEKRQIGTYKFKVEPFSEDFTGRIAWGNWGNILLRCAQNHASERHFGFGPMSEEQWSWVFSRLIIEIEDRPLADADFSVSTWASGVVRQFTTRLFTIQDAAGREIGHAYSVWALIDLRTRQPVDLAQLSHFQNVLLPTPDFPIKGPGRIRLKPEETTQAESIGRVSCCDLDSNGHANSIRLLEKVLDLFSKEWYEHNKLRRVEIAYAKETFYNQELHFYKAKREGGVYDVEIHHADGTIAVKAQLTFAPIMPTTGS